MVLIILDMPKEYVIHQLVWHHKDFSYYVNKLVVSITMQLMRACIEYAEWWKPKDDVVVLPPHVAATAAAAAPPHTADVTKREEVR
jgi:hypothetical protein